MSMVDIQRLDLERWKAMADFQLQFIEKLGKYKVDVATAEVKLAEASGLYAQAKAKWRIVKELEAALARMNKVRYQHAQHVKRIEKNAGRLGYIRLGEGLHSNVIGQLWQGYRFFVQMTPFEILKRIMETQIDPQARAGANFSYNKSPETPTADVPPDRENVLQLLEWMREKRYMARVGSRAYAQVVEALARIDGVADTEIARLEEATAKMEEQTYRTWDPVTLLGFPRTAEVKKITGT